MTDTFLFFSSPTTTTTTATMSNNQERICEIKFHINQLLTELQLIEPDKYSFQLFNLTLNSTSLSTDKYLINSSCPYLSNKNPILHSTTYHQYKKIQQQKKQQELTPKKKFLTLACATSTPKNSLKQNILLKKTQHHLTSTPRRNKRQSNHFIPLKRLLYNENNKDVHRQRYSTKRTIVPRYNILNPIDENPQWI